MKCDNTGSTPTGFPIINIFHFINYCERERVFSRWSHDGTIKTEEIKRDIKNLKVSKTLNNNSMKEFRGGGEIDIFLEY